MRVATKELVEKMLLDVANREQFSAISRDRSFALTDDIVLQSISANKNGECHSIDVFQITDSIWRDTKNGRVFAVFAEGRRYSSEPDQDGNYPDYVSKSTPALAQKPKRILIFNIDTGEACNVFDFTVGSKIYDADPDSTQRMLDSILSKAINKAYEVGRMKYDPEVKELCDKMCVEQDESNVKISQRIESKNVADYILGFNNGAIEQKIVPYDDKKERKEIIYLNSSPKYYIGVSATDDATPNQGDIKNANACPNKYFEMYKRIGHRAYEHSGEKIFCELYEGACYNIVDGLLGQKVVPVSKKVPSTLFAYTNTGNYITMSRVQENSIANDKAEIERTMEGMSGEIVGYIVNKDPRVHVGELIKELYSTNEQRIAGCQWAEDIKKERFMQSKLEQ
jgi:hypothetical protein